MRAGFPLCDPPRDQPDCDALTGATGLSLLSMQDWGYLLLVRRSFGKVGLLSTQSCSSFGQSLGGWQPISNNSYDHSLVPIARRRRGAHCAQFRETLVRPLRMPGGHAVDPGVTYIVTLAIEPAAVTPVRQPP